MDKPDRVMLPIVRHIVANTIAKDIVGVQPMSIPLGNIFDLTPFKEPSGLGAYRIKLAKWLRYIVMFTKKNPDS